MWILIRLSWIVILWGGYVEVHSEVTKKDVARKLCVHRGKGDQLFSKMDVDQCKEVFLYAKGVGVQIAATWSLKNGIIISSLTFSNYSGRINMTINGNIWILDVEEQDAGKYSLKCDTQKEGPEVELNVLEKLTEEQQIQECLNGHPHLTEIHSETMYGMNATLLWKKLTEGINHITNTTQRPKDHTEVINHSTTMSNSSKEVKKGIKHGTTTAQKEEDAEGRSCLEMYFWIKGIAAVVCLILVLVIVMVIIGVGFACMWHRKSKKMLTEDQVKNLLNDHLDVMKKYFVQTDTTLQEMDAKISKKRNTQLQRLHIKRLSASIEHLKPRENTTDHTGSFRETGLSDMQSISIDEQKANPEGDKAHSKSVETFGVPVKEDSNSEDECKMPLFYFHGDQIAKA